MDYWLGRTLGFSPSGQPRPTVPDQWTMAVVPSSEAPNPSLLSIAGNRLVWVSVFIHFTLCCVCVILIHSWVKCRDQIQNQTSDFHMHVTINVLVSLFSFSGEFRFGTHVLVV